MAWLTVHRNGAAYTPPHLSKEQDIPLQCGDRVRVRTPGGGGYGDPLERPTSAVLEDVLLGRYSLDQAQTLFGVEIRGDPATVDEVTTNKIRQRRKPR